MKKYWWHKSKNHTAIFSLIAASFIVLLGFVSVYVERAIKTRPLPASVGIPGQLVIPAIGVNTLIQSVGVDTVGRMGLPSNFTDVSWYKYGPRPGDSGSAVIAGHLDTAVDTNAVFADLSILKEGDLISIIDKTGQEILFKIIGKEVYDEDKAPLEKIFNQSGSARRLNLVTCDGTWNPKTKNYSQRLVIYSERVPDK
ncbi:MAG: class F sortase [Candidatus Taylorbacteria bacterium]|nr:class F sortase [Candidatus Taylorbacteria bacterium]